MICNKAKNDWSFLVDSVVFAYNISVNESTGYSPFYLTTGRHPNLPIAVLAGLNTTAVKHNRHAFVETMTRTLNEAYQYVRERQLRTLERNKRYQLGLGAGATQAEVASALARRPVPGFGQGELVSYWKPEAVDPDIEHIMPKKLQYRWEGPYTIQGRENDHYLMDRKNKVILTNPGRLRKYLTWTNDPWEGEENEPVELGKPMDTGVIEEGDMIVIALEMTHDMTRPFAIGKVLADRGSDGYLIHWYGNSTRELEGTYRPEWWVGTGRERRVYHAENHQGEVGVIPHTSDEVGQVIMKRHIVHYGFHLRYDDRLPTQLKRKMHNGTWVHWQIPKE